MRLNVELIYSRSGATVFLTLALSGLALPASATSILFVGNSFTYGDPAGGAPT